MYKSAIFFVLFLSNCCIAQSHFKFEYDPVGNRRLRHIVSPRIANSLDSTKADFDNISKFGIEVFPNPTTNKLNIFINQLEDGDKVILVLSDIQGKILIHRETSIKQDVIDMSGFINGNYFLRIIIRDEKFTYRVAKIE